MDLILHVGLPKTGTTLIQNKLLAHTAGYLGKAPGQSLDQNCQDIVYRLQTLAPWHRHLSDDELGTDLATITAQLVEDIYGRRQTNVSALTVSQEHLSKWPRTHSSNSVWPIETTEGIRITDTRETPRLQRDGAIPIADYVRNYLVPAWSPYGEVYILLTLRNQVEYLASLYAQLSDRIAKAGQKDFRYQVSRIIADNDPSINWHKIVIDLASAVGHDHLTVLFSEEMGTPTYWDEIGSFMRLADINAEAMSNVFNSRENARRTDELRWATRWRSGFHITQQLEARWNKQKVSQPKRNFLSALQYVESKLIDPIVIPLRSRSRDRSIYITSDMHDQIRQHCAESNDNLSSYLGRDDIRHLGY